LGKTWKFRPPCPLGSCFQLVARSPRTMTIPPSTTPLSQQARAFLGTSYFACWPCGPLPTHFFLGYGLPVKKDNSSSFIGAVSRPALDPATSLALPCPSHVRRAPSHLLPFPLWASPARNQPRYRFRLFCWCLPPLSISLGSSWGIIFLGFSKVNIFPFQGLNKFL